MSEEEIAKWIDQASMEDILSKLRNEPEDSPLFQVYYNKAHNMFSAYITEHTYEKGRDYLS